MTSPLKQNFWNAHPLAEQRELPGAGAQDGELWGYLEGVSHSADEPVRLFVHTTASRYAVQVVRDDPDQALVCELRDLPGIRQVTPADAAVAGCGWHSPVTLPVHAGWPPGPYLVRLSAVEGGQSLEGEAFFVLRAPSQADHGERIAMVLTTSTWNAYNDWGGANAYRSFVDGRSVDVLAPELSTRRPWARGLLRLPDDVIRHADVPDLVPGEAPTYPWIGWALERGFSRHCCDAGWAYYERPFYHWLLAHGYGVDLLTQEDLHARPDVLRGYRTALLVGHDEYWTWEMRDTVDAFVDAGGHLARFAGNMIWQVRLDLAAGRQTCYKLAAADPVHATAPSRTSTLWDAVAVGRPATQTFGLSGVSGGYHRFGATSPRASGGYTVYRPDHWALAGTDLYFGDVFGAGNVRIVGFECDGVDYGFRWGQPYPTGRDGAPADLEIIAMAPATAGEHPLPGAALNAPLDEVLGLLDEVPTVSGRGPGEREYGAGMVACFQRGRGTVFNAGCCEWVTGLIRHDACVEQVTHNVLRRFTGRSTA